MQNQSKREITFDTQLKTALWRKGQVKRSTFSCNMLHNKCCVASCDCLFHVLPPPRATNFHVAKSRNDVHFFQHENLLRAGLVIPATNYRNLLRKLRCATNCKKMLPVLLGLKCEMVPIPFPVPIASFLLEALLSVNLSIPRSRFCVCQSSLQVPKVHDVGYIINSYDRRRRKNRNFGSKFSLRI